MDSLLQNFLIYSFLAGLVPFSAAIFRYKKLQQPLKYLAILIFFDFGTEVITHIYFFLKSSNQFLWPAFIVIEFSLIMWIYRQQLLPMLIAKITPLLIPVFAIYTFTDWFYGKLAGLSAFPHFIEGVIILYTVLCYYYKTLKAPLIIHLERQPMFWLSTGLFIYFSVDSIIFIFSNYIQSFSLRFNSQIWFIHAIFNIVLYIFYTLAVCLNPKKQI